MTDPARSERMDPARLMAAIHGNDPAAFRELYRCYLPKLRYGIRAFIRRCPRLQAQEEEEIVSQAWIRLLAGKRKLLRSYDPQRASFGTFMAMVGANTAWKVAALKPRPSHDWHDAREDELVAELAGEADVETLVADRELLEKLDGEIRQSLSDRELRLLEDVIIWQRPSDEVAAELGIAVEAVWTATSRLRRKLGGLVTGMTSKAQAPPRLVRPIVVALLLTAALTNADPIRHAGSPAAVWSTGGEP